MRLQEIDFRGVEEMLMKTAQRLLPRISTVIALIYATFAVCYLFLGPRVLSVFTGLSALALVGAAKLLDPPASNERARLWIFGISAVVLINVNAAIALVGDSLFAASHMFCLLAAAVLLPTRATLSCFFVLSPASCFATLYIAGLDPHHDLATLGFVASLGIATLIFLTRFRTLSALLTLSESLAMNRDRDFREIIEKNPDAVVLLRDGVIIYASTPMATYLQADSTDELLGRPFTSLVAHDPGELKDLLAGKQDNPRCIVTLSRRDGEQILCDVAEPKTILFEGSEAVMLVIRDVTETENRLNAKLLLADRMSAAGTLASGVAHEINNPLTYVTVNLELLGGLLSDAGELDREDALELLGGIKNGVGRVASIVEELNALARIKDTDERSIDPLASLRTAVKLVENQLRHRTKLEVSLQALPKVTANDGKLLQVFVNLLLNAAEAIDRHPDKAREHTIELVTRRSRDEVIIEVRDTGPGMPDAVRARVFDPFFTTKEPGHGTGLGLFFCHSVITGLGGTIEVESSEGIGTTIRLKMPSSTRSTGRFAPLSERAGADAAPTPISVLVVDDEPFVGKAIARVLKGCDVTVAERGEDAIAEFERKHHDLVLCDIMMPGVSGPDVYERLVEIEPEVAERVVFMTGGAFTPKAREFADRLGDRVLRKPIAIDVLLALVADAGHVGSVDAAG